LVYLFLIPTPFSVLFFLSILFFSFLFSSWSFFSPFMFVVETSGRKNKVNKKKKKDCQDID